MSAFIRKYKIGKNRWERAFREGFDLSPDGVFTSSGHEQVSRLFFSCLDGAEDGCPWGRLVFDAQVSEDTVFTVHTFASDDPKIIVQGAEVERNTVLIDPSVSFEMKIALFDAGEETISSVYSDILLYSQQGRYLWICLTVQGGSASFSNFRAYAPGDRFFEIFPEVYRTNGEFLHRYLSVLSSLYNDFQEQLDDLDQLLNIDTAPADLLPIYASWFGISLDGDFIEDEKLRHFLKNAYRLIRKKGTREAVEALIGIFVEEPFYIVEHQDVIGHADGNLRNTLESLYGDDPFCFTLLLHRAPDEKLQLQLERLIEQFKPIRMNASIQFLEGNTTLDGGANLNINAMLARYEEGTLDRGAMLRGTDYLT